jgi:hypothetical protein
MTTAVLCPIAVILGDRLQRHWESMPVKMTAVAARMRDREIK